MKKVEWMAGLVAGLILGGLVSSGYASYSVGTTWDYQQLFGTNNGNPGRSIADSEGQYTFEYRYSGLDTGSTPAASTLMSVYHSWENPPSWQAGSDRTYEDRIYSYAIVGGNAHALQIHWIAPVDGTYDLSVLADKISDYGGWATQEKVWVNNVLQKSADNLGTDAEGTSFTWSADDVSLKAGDKVIFTFSSWASNTAVLGNFDMTATLVPEPCTLGFVIMGLVGFVAHRRR